jgi:hypothetical protein
VATPAAAPAPARRRVRPLTIALGVVLAGLVVMWVYAFVFASKDYLLAIDDDAWVEQADTVCARYEARIDALPPAEDFAKIEPLAEALRQRADVLDDANALVAGQIEALRALPAPNNAEGAELVDLWLADWVTYLADRQHHGAEWRAGVDDPFTVTADDGGAPVTEAMDDFAKNNRMPACMVPGDV